MKVKYTNHFEKFVDKIRDKKLLAEISLVISQIKTAEDVRQISHLKKMSGHKPLFVLKQVHTG